MKHIINTTVTLSLLIGYMMHIPFTSALYSFFWRVNVLYFVGIGSQPHKTWRHRETGTEPQKTWRHATMMAETGKQQHGRYAITFSLHIKRRWHVKL